jgi:predicted TIM-barrel fold metal-dependent hydrolase
MKIDIFNHVMPLKYLDMMKQHSRDPGIIKRMTSLRMLWDIEARVQMLEQWPDLQQVLTLSVPSPELVGGPELSPELARIANDGMAEMVAKWPRKFPAFVASLPMNNVPAALEEMDRAIGKLGARGVQVCTNVNGRALDEPEYFHVFERAPTSTTCRSGCIRRVPPPAPTMSASRSPSTRSGRCWAGPTRPASPWRE